MSIKHDIAGVIDADWRTARELHARIGHAGTKTSIRASIGALVREKIAVRMASSTGGPSYYRLAERAGFEPAAPGEGASP